MRTMSTGCRSLLPRQPWPLRDPGAWRTHLVGTNSAASRRTPRRLRLCESLPLGERRFVAVVEFERIAISGGGTSVFAGAAGPTGEPGAGRRTLSTANDHGIGESIPWKTRALSWFSATVGHQPRLLLICPLLQHSAAWRRPRRPRAGARTGAGRREPAARCPGTSSFC